MRFYQRIFLVLAATVIISFLTGCSSEEQLDLNSNQSISDTEEVSAESKIVSNTEEKSSEANNGENNMEKKTDNQIKLTINDTVLNATLEDNSSAEALKELLADGSLAIEMQDYGSMEKVGSIGTDLPTNNQQITTEAGDLILYMGNAFVIYYAPNSWNFTRLGKINDVTAEELKKILGSGNVEVTLQLTKG